MNSDAPNTDALWMSFADPHKPKGQQFLGVIIVRETEPRLAVLRAWRLGINPGGQILFYEIDASGIDPVNFDRLIQKDELVSLGYA